MKILLLDIETSPNIAHVWGLWNQTVSLNQLMESSYMMCFAAKWLGGKRTYYWSRHDHGKDVMLNQAHNLLTEADAVVHYNGNRFDIPVINKEFLLAGMDKPAPSKQIDLYSVVKRNFRFPSNKLDYVCTELGIGSKHKHAGHTLWVACLAGDPEAWKEMRRYNIQDILILEALYERLLPWIDTHPNRGLYDGEGCPNCGSGELTKQGVARTNTRTYQRFQCKVCGRWSRSSKSIPNRGVTVQGEK